VSTRSNSVMTTELDDLQDFATIANREIFNIYGARDSCIFSTAVVCDVLAHFGAKAEPLRVTTAIFPVNGNGLILGSDGGGVRRRAAKPGYWKGHLVSLVEDQYLVDTTLDQINRRRFCKVATPIVIYLPDTNWWDQRWPDYHCTGNLSLFPALPFGTRNFTNRRVGNPRPTLGREDGKRSSPD
jgi:hypothetical protein